MFYEFCKNINDKCRELQTIEKEFIDDKTAIEALALINTMKLINEGDYLRFISAVNLLNSFVKQDKKKLDYHFKRYVEKFLSVCVRNKVNFVKYNNLKDDSGDYIIIQFGELQFSFHNVKVEVEGLECITDSSLLWDGIRKQVCALTIYEMCKSSDLLTSNITKFGGNLDSKVSGIVEDFEIGYIDFNDDFNNIDMDDEEYKIFNKRFDRYQKYNLPYPFYDTERQVLEYVNKDYLMYDPDEQEYISRNIYLSEALSGIISSFFYYSFNTRLEDENGNYYSGHSHAHNFEEVVAECYRYPEHFDILDSDKEYYSEQQLKYLRRLKKYLLFIGVKDQVTYNDKKRYYNEFREKHLDTLVIDMDDDRLEKVINNKFIVYPYYESDGEEYFNHFNGDKRFLRNSNDDIVYLIEFYSGAIATVKDIKDKYPINGKNDDDKVEIVYFNILEKY